jgi:hypothetical protein
MSPLSFRYITIAFFILVKSVAHSQGEIYKDLTPLWDTVTVLKNPHKGWYIHYYDNAINKYGSSLASKDLLDDFPGLHHVYLRLAWGYLEPMEKQYNWVLIDSIINKWTAKGYKITFRITTKETDPDQVFATPEWVKEAGAKGSFVGENKNWEPDFDDPIFLEKLENFHRAFALRYDQKPFVEYIDIGSFGDWGEGHTVFGSKKQYPFETIKKHIDIYKRCYKKTLLMISDDFITSRSDKATTGKRIMQYILANGISIRDDSVSVKYFADHYGFSTLRSQYLFEQVWRKLPVDLELEHYHITVKENTWKEGKPFEAAIEEAHATYIGFHGKPRQWLGENRAFADRMANKVGYWYFMKGVSLPGNAVAGKKMLFDVTWLNRGVAPAYKQYQILLSLKAPGNKRVILPLTGNNMMWFPGEEIRERYAVIVPNNFNRGKVALGIKLIVKEGKGIRDIELGMQGKGKNGFYQLGEVVVLPSAVNK